MKRTAFHFINGILTFPGESENWNGRAVTWAHTHTGAKAEKIEYFCGPIGRAFGQRKRAEKLGRTLSFYEEWENIVVGHSNGASVALAMMQDYEKWPDISHLHLVCGACEADFEKNGLNEYLREWRLGYVTVYIAGKDQALRLAHTLPASLLGYGVLGLHGPRRIAKDVENRVKVIKAGRWKEFGHSSCWSEKNFGETMVTLTSASYRASCS